MWWFTLLAYVVSDTGWHSLVSSLFLLDAFFGGGPKITADGDCSHEIKRRLLLGRKVMANLDSIFKSRDITLPTKVHLVKDMVFPVVMYGCESWTVKNAEHRRIWCFWSVVLEKTLESPLDFKEIQLVHSKGNQSWVFIGRTDAEAETPILWRPYAKSWPIGKGPDAGRDWGQEEKRMTEDEMAGWHHQLNGHEFEWTLGVGDGQGGLACLRFMGSQRVGHDWATELNISCLFIWRIVVLYHWFWTIWLCVIFLKGGDL